MISSTTFDPFNHGTASIKFKSVSKTLFQKISVLLKRGWNIMEIGKIEEHDVGPKVNSNNFKISTSSKTYLLKISHINNTERQNLVNNCVLYCEEKGVPAPHLIKTRNHKTFLKTGKNILCLYDFIAGEHFDGSEKEIVNSAREVANLMQILKTVPFSEEIKKDSNFSYHDPTFLRKIIILALKQNSKNEIGKLVRKHHREILKSSQKVCKLLDNLKALPRQVVHGDLHPHNIMFDPNSKRLLAFLDFDTLEYAPRIRQIAHVMHRLARTYGEKTEKKNGIGTTIQSRIKLFRETFSKYGSLSTEERKLISLIIQDRELKGITTILKSHYLKKNQEWDFDLKKRITTLLEAKVFF